MHGEKKTVLYRYGAVVTALLMLLAVLVLPVMRAGASESSDDTDSDIGGYNTSNRIWVVPSKKYRFYSKG